MNKILKLIFYMLMVNVGAFLDWQLPSLLKICVDFGMGVFLIWYLIQPQNIHRKILQLIFYVVMLNVDSLLNRQLPSLMKIGIDILTGVFAVWVCLPIIIKADRKRSANH